MVRGRHAGVVSDFQSTPTVQQKPGTTGGADSVRTASCQRGGTRGRHGQRGTVAGQGGEAEEGGKVTVKGVKISRHGDGEGEREREKQLVRQGKAGAAYPIPSCRWGAGRSSRGLPVDRSIGRSGALSCGGEAVTAGQAGGGARGSRPRPQGRGGLEAEPPEAAEGRAERGGERGWVWERAAHGSGMWEPFSGMWEPFRSGTNQSQVQKGRERSRGCLGQLCVRD